MSTNNMLVVFNENTKTCFIGQPGDIKDVVLTYQNERVVEKVASLKYFRNLNFIKLNTEAYDLLNFDVRDNGIHGLVKIASVYHYSDKSGLIHASQPYLFKRDLKSIDDLRTEINAGNLYIAWDELIMLHGSKQEIMNHFYNQYDDELLDYMNSRYEYHETYSEIVRTINRQRMITENAINYALQARDIIIPTQEDFRQIAEDLADFELPFEDANNAVNYGNPDDISDAAGDLDDLDVGELSVFDDNNFDLDLNDLSSIGNYSDDIESNPDLEFDNLDLTNPIFPEEDEYANPVDQLIPMREQFEASARNVPGQVLSISKLREYYSLIGPRGNELGRSDLVNALLRAIDDRLDEVNVNNNDDFMDM